MGSAPANTGDLAGALSRPLGAESALFRSRDTGFPDEILPNETRSQLKRSETEHAGLLVELSNGQSSQNKQCRKLSGHTYLPVP